MGPEQYPHRRHGSTTSGRTSVSKSLFLALQPDLAHWHSSFTERALSYDYKTLRALQLADMTALQPRVPYTDEELRKLYPDGLELQLVQVLLRHGERTPVSARFQNAALPAFWPYCSSARQLRSAVLEGAADEKAGEVSKFSTLEWKRRLETFGRNDEAVVATGPGKQVDNICDLGSLTDVGRASTYQLGLRLRKLYVDRLRFIPSTISSTDFLYLRSTPIPRALESLHQTFSALYPPSTRETGPDGTVVTPTILTRAPGDETLYPNDGNCRRFAALSRAFAQRAADRWNPSEEMEYLNQLVGKWMPPDRPKVAVDSRPRLSGIMDSINATLAHGPETRLPKEFYDAKGRKIIEKIAVDEWFSGYKESRDYRMLGIGSLMGDIVERMVGSVETIGGAPREHGVAAGSGRGIKLGLSGCHDTTLAGVLASLGTFEHGDWPPFTSHIAIEMFRKSTPTPPSGGTQSSPAASDKQGRLAGFLPSFFRSRPSAIGRRPTEELTPAESQKLDGYYVRLRYNDEPVTVPGCRTPGNHLDGDESFCTLVSTGGRWSRSC